MGFFDQLKRMFGGSGGGRDDGIYLYVRCNRCGDRVRVRVNSTSELQQEFKQSDRASGYSVRKMVVDQRCFRPIEIRLRFDARRNEQERTIEGGTFLSQEEFEASEPTA